MRRHDREITSRESIDSIIRRCHVCRLAMCDNGQPYIVPLSFGYDGENLYFHAAPQGRKADILARNSQVCFEFDIMNELVMAEHACGWSMRYESVIGFGDAEMVTGTDARRAGLNCIMRQYSGSDWSYNEQALENTLVIRVKIREISGKTRS